jgi:hypothetical protein
MPDNESINHHFRRETKLMLWWLIGIPVVLVALGALLGPKLMNAHNAAATNASAMSEQQFWTLVKQAKGPGEDAEHTPPLTRVLAQKTPKQVLDFKQLFRQFCARANHGDAWAAGMLLNQAHSNDSGFDYFRN